MGRMSLCAMALLAAAISASSSAWASVNDEIHRPSAEKGDVWDTAATDDPRLDDRVVQNQTSSGASVKDYLNGLVEASVLHGNDQVADIVYLKTHKTGSSTLSSLLYRYAVRHHLKLAAYGANSVVDLERAAAKIKQNGQTLDVMHYHIALRGQYHGNWTQANLHYQNIMRNPDRINYITQLREPRSHLLSFYYFYIQPNNQLSIEDFFMKEVDPDDDFQVWLNNPLSAEFGVRTQDDLDYLISVLPDFKVVLLTDRFDEGLLLLGHLLHWHLIDLTYVKLNETKPGLSRSFGKPLIDRPNFEDLPKTVQDRIDELTLLDRVLYEAGKSEYEKRLHTASGAIEESMARFKSLRNITEKYLDANPSSRANRMYRGLDFFGHPTLLAEF